MNHDLFDWYFVELNEATGETRSYLNPDRRAATWLSVDEDSVKLEPLNHSNHHIVSAEVAASSNRSAEVLFRGYLFGRTGIGP